MSGYRRIKEGIYEIDENYEEIKMKYKNERRNYCKGGNSYMRYIYE